MATIITMPSFFDTMKEGTVANWQKKVGDTIKVGEVLVEIETDIANFEFESFSDGILLYIGIQEEQTAPLGGLLAIIGNKDEDISGLIKNQENKNKKVSKLTSTISTLLADDKIDTTENLSTEDKTLIKKLNKKNPLVGLLTKQEKCDFVHLDLSLNGFTKLYYGFITFLKFILGFDPLRFFIALNTILLIIGIASGENLIIWFMTSNLIFGLIIHYMNIKIQDQFNIETDFEDNEEDPEFIPINNSYWGNIYKTEILFSKDDFIFFTKKSYLKAFRKKDILDYPIFDLSSLRNIYIFSGLYLKDNIIPKKRINFSNTILKKIEEKDISSRVIIVLEPKNSNGYPIIISFKDFDSSFKFLSRIIQKTYQEDNIIKKEEDFEIYEEERWLKKNIEESGIQIILPIYQTKKLPDDFQQIFGWKLKLKTPEHYELFLNAAKLTIEHQIGSADLLKKKLNISKNYASLLIDKLEEDAIIAPFEGEKFRRVLVSDLSILNRYSS